MVSNNYICLLQTLVAISVTFVFFQLIDPLLTVFFRKALRFLGNYELELVTSARIGVDDQRYAISKFTISDNSICIL